MNNILLEDKRRELINVSKHADNYAPDNQQFGKNRYERRLKSRVSSSVKEYNAIDMNKFFKDDILTVFVPVRGETSHYAVGISFGNVLSNIQDQVSTGEPLSVKVITRALIKSFNDNDVRIRCDCPDFIYRQSYWLSVDDIILGDKETRPSDITNPGNTKGRGCKHILLVLNNNSWLMKVSSCIYNYVNYIKAHYERLYADIIYPAIYGEPYDDDVQLDIFDDELSDDDIDVANKYAKTKTQFKKGNEYRFQPIEQEDEKQISLEMD